MLVQLNRKQFLLVKYDEFLRKKKVPVVFFFSRFGKAGPCKIPEGAALRSLKASLVRKVIANDIFSGTCHLLYSAADRSGDAFLDGFSLFRLFSVGNRALFLQNVAVGHYIFNYSFFKQLTDPFKFLPTFFETGSVGSAPINLIQVKIFVPFFVCFLVRFLRAFFVPHLNILGALVFRKDRSAYLDNSLS